MECYPLNFFILLILMLHVFNYGAATMDEAGFLTAFRRTKMQSQGKYTVEEKWFSNTSFEETTSRKMEDDLIKQGLPGQPFPVKFKQYAGYISVDKSTGRSLFYYFTEAVNNPSSKPLILWLNGGPGCSSLGVGAMVEIGPFGVKSDGKSLYARQFSWNKVANVLYVESPAGVGFSYSNATSDYELSGDTRTAQDAYNFLLNWFARFPQYRAKDFYIIGESYAGFYIPELADVIFKKNMDKKSVTKIQLKGIMVGNGIMNDATDNNGTFDYMWSHAMISDETYQGLMEYCTSPNFNRTKCDLVQFAVDEEVGKIDFYNIYGPVCSHSRTNVSKKTKCAQDYDPCELSYVRNYLNLPQVQEILHANGTKIPYAWDACSEMVHSYWKDSPSSMFPIYKSLISSGLRILIYSGDMDAVVPVTSTRYSLNALNLQVNKPWHYWEDDLGEVGGYQIVYEGLTFSTVRGAGHEVPRVQPQRSFSLLKKFIAGQF